MHRSSPPPTSRALLDWYDTHRRDLPWRMRPGEPADPYRVWLSEIMLQQTTVAAVIPYFEAFTSRWPTVQALAAAPEAEVMAAWAGLGYYARARNLIACAKAVTNEHGGRFPDTEAGLLALPGVGAYTAAAIAAIAFGRAATVVDGNVERVMARLFAVRAPLPAAKPEFRRLAATLTPEARPGDYAQAVMDLGATVCRPKAPLCLLCPWSNACAARAQGIAESLPARARKASRPVRYGIAFWAQTSAGEVLVRERPPKGLLGGMTEIPSTDWREAVWTEAEALPAAPVNGAWESAGSVGHTFTHFHLELQVWRATHAGPAEIRPAAAPDRCRWARIDALGKEALPTLMRKVAKVALG